MNDYQTPNSRCDNLPNYRLYSIGGIIAATFLGAPVAAGIVMSANYLRIGRRKAALTAALLGLLATIAIILGVLAIPNNVRSHIPNLAFCIPQLLIVSLVAKRLQGPIIAKHREINGSMVSNWRPVGIGAICLVLIAGLLYGYDFLHERSLGRPIHFENDTVYVSGDATATDASKLASALKNDGLFGKNGVVVLLHASGGKYLLSFAFVDDTWQSADASNLLSKVGHTIAGSVFPSPLTIQLCDKHFTPKKSIRIE